METSFYQSVKLEIIDLVSLSKDAIHIHIGLFVFVFSIVLLRKPKFICLVPVLLIALLMEILDLYDDHRSLGYFRLGNSLHDIINTIFWPIVILALLQIKEKREQDS